MKNTAIILAAVLLLIGCRNEKIQIKDYKGKIDKINDLISGLGKNKEVINIPSREKRTVVAKNGLKFLFDPDQLISEDGSPVGDSVSVEITECINQADFIRSNIQTTSEGKLLVSYGAYRITMFSQGKKLKLKNDDSLQVYLPRFSNDETDLFYGQKDSLGRIEWIDAGKKLEKMLAASEVRRTKVIDYKKDSLYEQEDTFIVSNDPGKERENKVAVPAIGAGNSLLEKITGVTFDTLSTMREYYLPIKISSLDWINCDRFYQIKEKTNIRLHFETNRDSLVAKVYLIFKDINSVTSATYIKYRKSIINDGFSDMPVNSDVRIVAVSLHQDKIWGFSKDFKIQENYTVNIKLFPVTVKQLDDLINLK